MSPLTARLHVGFDYLPAVQHAPGVGRYVRELVRALARLEDGPRLALFEGGLGPRPLEGAPLGLADARVPVLRRRVRVPRRALGLLARCGLGADRLVGGPQVFHRVHAGHPPLSRAPSTLAIAELPRAGSPAERALGDAARAAAGVFVFDATYGARLAARFDLDAARVHCVPVGAEHWARDLAALAQRDALDEPLAPRAPPELVVLGALRASRAPLRVLAAFEALTRGGVEARLCFVGHAGDAEAPFRAALARSPARDAIEWSEAPRERDLPIVVGGATVLVHLAEDEGSAVTPLEAFRAGLAVVASDLPAFRAALGDAARYVAHGDDAARLAEQFAAAIAEGRDATGRAARRRIAAPYTWDASARAHLDAWRRILRVGPDELEPSHRRPTAAPQ